MKNLSAIVASVLLATACGRPGTAGDAPVSGISDVDSLNNLAWIVQGEDDIPTDSFISLQRQAVDMLHDGHHSDKPVEILSQMGFFCNITGDYSNGIEYLQEAADTLAARPELASTESAIELYGNLGGLYTRLFMGREALAAFDRGIEISRSLGGVMMSDLLRFKADAYDRLQLPDSAMACLADAHNAIDTYRTNADKERLHRAVDYGMAEFILEYSDRYSDRLPWATHRLEEIVAAGRAEGANTNDAEFSLGKAYILSGRKAEGLALMNAARRQWKALGDDDAELYAIRSIMDAYSRLGMSRELAAMFNEYDVARDTMLNREKLDALIGAEIRYRAKARKTEAEKLSAQLELSRRTAATLWLALALAVSLVVIFLQALYVNRRRRQTAERGLASVLVWQQSLNAEIERINSELEQSRNTGVMESVKQALNPSALTGESEQSFRRSFAALHPHFLPDLRGEYPGLTPNDELVCMLIYMGMSTDEIALSLGISRPSVNSARYRIRKKLSLTKEADLDSFLKSRKG